MQAVEDCGKGFPKTYDTNGSGTSNHPPKTTTTDLPLANFPAMHSRLLQQNKTQKPILF